MFTGETQINYQDSDDHVTCRVRVGQGQVKHHQSQLDSGIGLV